MVVAVFAAGVFVDADLEAVFVALGLVAVVVGAFLEAAFVVGAFLGGLAFTLGFVVVELACPDTMTSITSYR